MPKQVFKDATNTNTLGNLDGVSSPNDSGQLPGQTTWRDAHALWSTKDGKYIHVSDRIGNVVEVFNTETYERSTYDLMSTDGRSGRSGSSGPCFARSVTDDFRLPLNDPVSAHSVLTSSYKIAEKYSFVRGS